MKRKSGKRAGSHGGDGRRSAAVAGTKGAAMAESWEAQLGQVSFLSLRPTPTTTTSSSSSADPDAEPEPSLRLPDLLESDPSLLPASAHDAEAGAGADCILSQDFFCTPDYITPDNQNLVNGLDKDNFSCPKSPEKLHSTKTKRFRQDQVILNPQSPIFSGSQQIEDLAEDTLEIEEAKIEKKVSNGKQQTHSYVPQSAIALRCRVMPPPCIRNPYLSDALETDIDPFGNQRSKCAGLFSSITGGDGLSRYHTDFHEIEQIGAGNFSCVLKVLKRIDGCLYAVKQSIRPLYQDWERRKALMEVQSLAALGSHENIVGYYSSWFENEHLYIQMELCDYSLSSQKSTRLTEWDALTALYQLAKALLFMHERGIAHLDVKPDNIYVKNGVYKLGDFGCATLLNSSLPVEEGDARYMPQEILNDNFDHLDKVDIFSMGASMYELIRGSPLPESGPQFLNLREGKLPLLPGHSLHFQNLLKVMMDPDPTTRPSAKELVANPIFDRIWRNGKT
ncbi:LOW QUALITY PROTEIN: wee1-like protein kinase [Eucalyptus grandis]|uniref:LOW QUALITY PROTEIN: wee1-like protein kinase n=1 Tax=Eucalyptus grandis TaxID=71139 RepID=UPI00192EAE73|nr:LOW QUALITY PROTEIN: wee1-like protein kinase [Eucalyptus grandis]